MAVRSIISVDVQDGSFRNFARLFDRYQTALKSTPAAWKLVQQNIDGSKASFDKLVAQMAAANVQAKLREEAQKRADRLTMTAAERWQSIAKSTRDFATNVKEATLSLLRWTSVTGLITGLAGAGGLFGIDRLALGVAGSRRSALGLGATIGQQASFGTNLSRLVDPQQFLASVAEARFDVTRRVGLLGAGLSEKDLAGNTAQTAVALLRRLKQIADTTDPRVFAQVLQARRLDQFATPQDLERLRATSPQEFQRVLGQYGERAKQFELPGDVAERWQDFATQMSNAGKAIETVFVKGLADLAPGLTKLSESVAKVIESFLSSPALARWVKEANSALEHFAEYVGSDDFRQNVESVAKGVAKLAKAVASFVSWVAGTDPDVAKDRAAAAERRQGLRDERKSGVSAWTQLGRVFTGGAQMSEDQLLGMVRKLEGSGDAAVSPKGAVGRYQITPDTAKTYGGDPSRLSDPAYSEALARKILADLVRRYHGNTAQVLAAYNAGPGRADRFRAAGDDPSVLPRETQGYLQRARGMQGYSPITVTVENNTGGNAAVSVNGLKD